MIELLSAVLFSAVASPETPPSLRNEPTRYCREVIEGPSRSQSVRVCRTKAEWRRYDSCRGSVTRYCAPRKKDASLGKETAFPLNEDSRIVCHMLAPTGTRLTQVKTCLPLREWERMWKDTAESVSVLQNKSAKANELGPQ